MSINKFNPADAVQIEDISRSHPAVARAPGHPFRPGDRVRLGMFGMRQLDDQVVRVANVTADTFELCDVDSRTFDMFVSGIAVKATFETEPCVSN